MWLGGKMIVGLDHPEGLGHPEGTNGEFRADSAEVPGVLQNQHQAMTVGCPGGTVPQVGMGCPSESPWSAYLRPTCLGVLEGP